MKSNRVLAVLLSVLGLGTGLLAVPSAAQAGGGVHWSVGVGAPGGWVGISNVYTIRREPPPVYYQPQPVYVQPQPVYVQPAPIYVRPQPFYAAPPLYYGAPPVLVRPAPVYPIGWAPRGPGRHHHHHREYRRGPGWRY